ncbi:MAG: sulfotransferase domain-containing protein, partial [Deltaproteobacteria bacterium]|nr:sulfotransferase domain-containing protein [Deltaproteobacteria bacterium]
IVLDEVYGIESSAFANDRKPAINYTDFPVVKTHELPDRLVPSDPEIPAVYIVRDGRDALVSIAHHRKDIIAPGTNFNDNLRTAILAKEDSHFGGWSNNVNNWLKRASIVIKFEDLIVNPIETIEKIRPLIDLPEPQLEKLPSFGELKNTSFKYISSNSKLNADELSRKFFRRGKVGAWKEEMPEELQRLFWKIHGKTMIELGYEDKIPEFPKQGILNSLTNLLRRR